MTKFVASFAILLAGFLFSSTVSMAKMEYTKKEKKPCATCHVTATSKELNATGKHYQEKKTLEGAPAAKAEKK
jgi:hypothetical protein